MCTNALRLGQNHALSHSIFGETDMTRAPQVTTCSAGFGVQAPRNTSQARYIFPNHSILTYMRKLDAELTFENVC